MAFDETEFFGSEQLAEIKKDREAEVVKAPHGKEGTKKENLNHKHAEVVREGSDHGSAPAGFNGGGSVTSAPALNLVPYAHQSV